MLKFKKLFPEIVGWYGMLAIMIAYGCVSFHVFTPDQSLYQILNGTGGVGIVINSLSRRAYPPAALNFIWTIIAAVALIRILTL